MPPMFEENQKLDESKLVDYLDNKAQRCHKDMLIYQGFNPETSDLVTFVEHCERAETRDNIAGAKCAALDEDNDTKRKNKSFKFKERKENGKKSHKKNLRFIALSMVRTKATPPGNTKSSKQGLKTKLSIQQRITRGSPEN